MRAAILVAVSVLAAGAQAIDPLADMRRAVGDEAALARVSSFEASGTAKSISDRHTSEVGYQVQCRLADRFVVTTSQQMSVGPLGSGTLINRHGFDKNTLIAEVSNDLGLPTPPAIFYDGPAPRTPSEIDEDLRRRVMEERARMVAYTLPMFGASFSGADVTIAAAPSATIDGHQFSVVKATRWDGVLLTLFIDDATHLPARLTWMAAPPVTRMFSSSSTVTTRGGQVVGRSEDPVQTEIGPAGPPAGLVEHEMTFSEFKADAGFMWPHRWTTRVAGQITYDVKLGKFKIKTKS